MVLGMRLPCSRCAPRIPPLWHHARGRSRPGFNLVGLGAPERVASSSTYARCAPRSAKPTDLPVEQPTHFDLEINLQIAKAIGHEVPAGLVLRADDVID
jgi:putative ABC transport system substrate-binding protein